MRNSNEISAELAAKMAEFDACQDAAQRKTLAGEVEALTNEFNEASVSEAARKALANQRTLSPKEEKELKRFSISKFLRQAQAGELDGLEAEMAKEGKEEFLRSIPGAAEGVFIPSFLLRTYYDTNASEANYGQAFVEQKSLTYVDALRDAMLGTKLGVRYLDGLVGNVAFVKNGGATAAWYAEEAEASLSKPTYTKVTMSPKRLQVIQGVTYDLLHQSSLAVDRLIMDDLTKAHAGALDAAIFNGSGSSGQPTGVLNASGVNDISIDTNGGAITYNLLVQMETEVAVDNGLLGNLAYVSNAKVQGKLKTIPQIAGYPVYLINDGKVNGYPFLMSNSIPSNLTKAGGSNLSAIIFGAWSEVFVGGWGGLQFILDPYSEKARGVLEISAAAYHDVLVRRPEAFCIIDEVSTT
jgi:hypothetical protein